MVGANVPPPKLLPRLKLDPACAGDLFCVLPKDAKLLAAPPNGANVVGAAAAAAKLFAAGAEPKPKVLVVAVGDLLLKPKTPPAAGAGVVAANDELKPKELAAAGGAPNGWLCC